MRIEIRTNEDDWRELSTEGLNGIAYRGHTIPPFVWFTLLRAAGVEVTVIFDDFSHGD